MEIILLFIVILGMIILQAPALEWLHKLNERRQYKQFLSHETFYHSIVSRYFKYYNRLNLEEQRKFLFRTYLYKRAKKISLYRS